MSKVVSPISWDAYFMEIAKTVSIKSKDPATKVGAILVNEDRHIIGTGYNGFPPGFPDTSVLWEKPAKYQYVVHAEINCLLHSVRPPKGGTLYSTMFPCPECAKVIASSGISRVVYSCDRYQNAVSELIFLNCGIELVKLDV